MSQGETNITISDNNLHLVKKPPKDSLLNKFKNVAKNLTTSSSPSKAQSSTGDSKSDLSTNTKDEQNTAIELSGVEDDSNPAEEHGIFFGKPLQSVASLEPPLVTSDGVPTFFDAALAFIEKSGTDIILVFALSF